MMKYIYTLACVFIAVSDLAAMNLVRPYQILLRPPKITDSWLQAYGIAQFGFGSQAFGLDGESVNPLQVYECRQDGLSMLNGFDSCSSIGQLNTRINAEPDLCRGQFLPNAHFKVDGFAEFGLRFFFKHGVSLACYLPYYTMSLNDVCWNDLTGCGAIQDVRTHTYLTDCLSSKVCCLGGLDIGSWKRKGFGDTTVSLEWIGDFAQNRDLLRSVMLNGRLGMTLPTALKEDEDKILAFSYGNDGAIGVVFALGIDLSLGCYVQAGLDVQLMHVFGNTRCRRIKTDLLQTEFLLLQKVRTFIDYGLDQQFSLYLQVKDLLAGASLKLAYQFYKTGRNELALTSNEFSSAIANSSLSLLGYTTHDLFVILSYDFKPFKKSCNYVPYTAAFVDIPFNGKRSVVAKTAGFTVGVNY